MPNSQVVNQDGLAILGCESLETSRAALDGRYRSHVVTGYCWSIRGDIWSLAPETNGAIKGDTQLSGKVPRFGQKSLPGRSNSVSRTASLKGDKAAEYRGLAPCFRSITGRASPRAGCAKL